MQKMTEASSPKKEAMPCRSSGFVFVEMSLSHHVCTCIYTHMYKTDAMRENSGGIVYFGFL